MNSSQQLINFIRQATSPYHVVERSREILEEHGFLPLSIEEPWSLTKNGRYYVKVHGTTLFAFTIGKNLSSNHTFRIAAAHTDYPCLRIKPACDMWEKDYLRLNIELYGGLIKNTWLDRPLSIAGKVTLKSQDIFHPNTKLTDFKRPLLTIPNLAIHLNRDVNKGVELNNQTEMLPLLAMANKELNKEQGFLHFLSREISVPAEEILDFDLYIYNCEEGCQLGMNQEFISAPRLDNLTSVLSCLNGITKEAKTDTINIAALFDNEEIGSRSKQGADSIITSLILGKIYDGLSLDSSKLYNTILKSHMLSIDVAHAYHPNYSSKSDPAGPVSINQGVILKMNSSQRYATDTEAIGAIQQLLNACDIPFQKFVNRSDITGGGTLGSLTSSWLPMKTVDLGVPLLAMHSARELIGAKDQDCLNRLAEAFYTA